VFGNTSIGIFKDDPSNVFLDMSNIPELQTVSTSASSITIGSAISITNLISILESNASMSASYTVLADHLSIVANTSVRNAGCWAGNLMLTHNNADFPSDIFTIMAAANATLTIANSSGSQVYDLFSFLQLNMTGCVIVSITIPVLAANQKLMTFKIMPRHINSHAYVNAGFLMTVDSNQNGAYFFLNVLVYL
jgi:xanthine dehydrogenase/oxidase